ncbi:MFS transporter [Kitasatospora sp. NBC_01246]|uniref:MFS transporter n=1 Tax=Kitasatospora sp. NBC_01246 TaxID=2903570 RepID=UPI002E333373|nr:MFS transporter [Kitasatospora sp. NBC_01246]
MNTPARRRLTLAGSITGASIVALDGTVLTVARPAMQHDLNASFTAVQWTSTAYLIAVASLLVFAGRLGDRYGHQRVFAVGVLGFAAASAGIGLAPGIGWVIGLRVAQGVAGALLQPATLGMLRAAYPADRLAMPIALRTSVIGLAAAAGPVVGGALTTQLGWRAVFFLTVLPAVAAGLAALAVRIPQPPADRSTGALRALDLPGAALLAAALVCLVHTLVGVPEHGRPAATAFGLLAAALLGTAFVHQQRRAAHPLLPPRVFASPTVASSLGVLLTASAALFGTLFLATYFLQDVLGLDPFQSGVRALPLAVTMVAAAPAAAVLMRRHGARATAGAGMLLLTLGTLLAARFDESTGAVAIGGSFLLLGSGFGAVMVTATAALVRDASVADAGVAGGLQQTVMNIGPALGTAAATTLTAGRPLVTAMGPALLVLAATAAVGVLLAPRLPTRARARAAGVVEATRPGH